MTLGMRWRPVKLLAVAVLAVTRTRTTATAVDNLVPDGYPPAADRAPRYRPARAEA
ncbi:hypothetical protein [Streptomyces sp. NPDC001380]|uniref:hypothetical protein n=1 Tax=Streptomyces sp. NPDC001380 TaxID=3364566 RepID=UPI0036C7CF2D